MGTKFENGILTYGPNAQWTTGSYVPLDTNIVLLPGGYAGPRFLRGKEYHYDGQFWWYA